MGQEEITSRILSDAEQEANEILSAAKAKAEATLAAAKEQGERMLATSLEEAERRSHEIYELKAAAARLDGAKLLLQEKHTVIDGLYEKAENALNALNKEDTLALYSRLLETYAEEGDTVYLSENCVVSEELRHIDAVTKKKLVIAKERLPIRGGMILKGTTSDKDLSFAALLHEDREEYAAQIAGELFKDHV